MASAIQKFLSAPRIPHLAAGFVDDNFAVVDLRRSRNGFALASSAVTQLPAQLITPNFDSTNIQDAPELVAILRQTAEAAGLANRKQWSIALPEGAARSIVVTLESKPANRKELNEVIAWKVERVIAMPSAELLISRQKLKPLGKQERYLTTVARHAVLDEYESLFQSVGWQTGLMLPRHIGEAQWLMHDKTAGDKMLVSSNREGFTALVVRDNEPVLVRNYTCDVDSKADDLHRFALYYRERLAQSLDAAPQLAGLLVLGDIDESAAQEAVGDALDEKPHIYHPHEFGLYLDDEQAWFTHLSGAAGLASLAWR
ncbi:MAG: hypothetical protein HY231_14385 [Acidobacteria bacterium]|nr:hypothetical protein [Acidobacteriota bacterium]